MKPDKTEKAIRFGCSFGFGLIAVFLSAVIFAAAAVCGVLAMKQGNSFWHSLKDWWWWP